MVEVDIKINDKLSVYKDSIEYHVKNTLDKHVGYHKYKVRIFEHYYSDKNKMKSYSVHTYNVTSLENDLLFSIIVKVLYEIEMEMDLLL